MKNPVFFAALFLFGLLLAACNSKPEVIEGQSVSDGTGVVFPQAGDMAGDPAANQEHKVVAKEVLDTEKYTYLRVTEKEEEFWIAIPKSEVEVGNTYYYSGGLMKKNFLSREYNRVFETLYLVSGISDEPMGSGGSAVEEALSNLEAENAVLDGPVNVEPAKGAIKISELMANLKKYEGKVVKITGKCVKVNPMIMGRNWVHLQDGSAGNPDLTVTTDQVVPLGSIVTLKGAIALDKDFGAGYRYDVIMEGAVVEK